MKSATSGERGFYETLVLARNDLREPHKAFVGLTVKLPRFLAQSNLAG